VPEFVPLEVRAPVIPVTPEGAGLRVEDPAVIAARLAAIIESSDDAIVSKDLNGIITSWNEGAERLFGYAAEETLGRSIRMLVPADRQDEENEVLRRIRIGERVDHFETIRRRRDGTFVDISLTVSPIHDATGRVVGASKIARDITDRKVSEAILAESMELKNQFLSLVSHELRTPISIILGNGHLLRRRGDTLTPEDRDQALVDLTSQAERLQLIIENLLTLTRAEAREDLELDYVKVERVAAEVVAEFETRTRRNVVLSSDACLPPVMGEDTVTRMVLGNFLSNADKYSPTHQPIEIRIARVGSMVEVQVMDRGMGLTELDVKYVFDPFYRSAAAKAHAGGMGLGLAVCRKVIEVQGGTISGRPRAGGGAVFSFALPVAPDAEE